ncbi:Uncharacterized protein TCM_008746 [Theobroma cacao]|uniref:Uncharacterized protein n=1 Tax=Theobroma cacao TaxID=3641 RepID=A0A061E461_THECC|nr:Uncharacterized protein TCM_008746 [Theobroma cacao]
MAEILYELVVHHNREVMNIGNMDLHKHSYIEMTNDVFEVLVDDSNARVGIGFYIRALHPKAEKVFELKNDGDVLKFDAGAGANAFDVNVNAGVGTTRGRIGEASSNDLNASTSSRCRGRGKDRRRYRVSERSSAFIDVDVSD